MRIDEVWILGSLFAAASLAGLLGYVLKRRQPANPALDNLNARIRAWWVMILIGGAALLAGRIAIILLFACVSFLALREFMTTSPGRTGRSIMLFCYAAVPVQYGLIGLGRYELFCIWIPVFCFLALAIVAALLTSTERFLDRTGAAFWGLIVCVYCLSHIPALLMLQLPGDPHRAPLLVAFLVLIAQVSDILQYVFGKLLGQHPLLPRISPSKTVEGLAGGLFSAAAFGALLAPITPFNAWQAGGISLLIAVLGFLGGLVMSAIKRDRGIKDWGSWIQGHGGMLDRVDSLCFSAPVFFHLTRYFFAAN